MMTGPALPLVDHTTRYAPSAMVRAVFRGGLRTPGSCWTQPTAAVAVATVLVMVRDMSGELLSVARVSRATGFSARRAYLAGPEGLASTFSAQS